MRRNPYLGAMLAGALRYAPLTIVVDDRDQIRDDLTIDREEQRRKAREERAAKRERLLKLAAERDRPIIDAAAQRRAAKNARRLASLYRVKIVPDAEPDADGEWITLEVGKEIREALHAAKFEKACILLKGRIPPHHHIVAVGAP